MMWDEYGLIAYGFDGVDLMGYNGAFLDAYRPKGSSCWSQMGERHPDPWHVSMYILGFSVYIFVGIMFGRKCQDLTSDHRKYGACAKFNK